MAVGGTVLVIYSFLPQKGYSKQLLGYSYQKPAWAVAMFAIVLFALTIITQALVGVKIPIMGSENVQIPQSYTQGAVVTVAVSAGFEWPFWVAIAIAAICVLARVYHGRISKNTDPIQNLPPTQPPTQP